MLQTKLVEQLGIKYPIIQAPMAGGVTSTELVTAVAKEGALGMIGAGYQSALSLREQIQEIKRVTTNPIGVNLFVPSPFEYDANAVKSAQKKMTAYFQKFGIDDSTLNIPSMESTNQTYEAQMKVLLEEKVPFCSFTFGIPSKEVVERLQANGTFVIGTATTVKEAQLIDEAGMDAIVVQGSEAGGHRGTFYGEPEGALIGLFALIPQVVDQTKLPVIAAGGIMDSRGMLAALCLGAQAVQMGTAFLLTEESGANTLHQQMLLDQSKQQTVLTTAFSGKMARGLQNTFTEEMKDTKLPSFPIQNVLTQRLRKASKEKANHQYMSLWAGQAFPMGKRQSVKSLIETMMEEASVKLN